METTLGQSRQRRAELFASQPNCIFCGGVKPSETEEHCPARGMFNNRVWPEGFSFGACATCNSETADSDAIVALIARFGSPGLKTQAQLAEFEGLLVRLRKRQPEIAEGLAIESIAEKRARARGLGLRPGRGQTWLDVGLINVPPGIDDAVATFAKKLTKALHFKHTGRIVPAQAGILFRWFSNADAMRGLALPEVFARALGLRAEQRRNGRDLADQFDYRCSCSNDGELGMFACAFRESFGFMTMLAFDRQVLENAMQKACDVANRADAPLRFI